MLSIVSSILWFITFLGEPLFILLRFVGLGYYIIQNDEEKVRNAFKILGNTTLSSATSYQYGKITPSGVFIGLNCIGYYTAGNKYDMNSKISILTRPDVFNSLIKNDESTFTIEKGETVITEKKTVKTYSTSGSYTDTFYSSRDLNVTNLKPQGEQAEIVSKIVSLFNEKGRATIFLHGVSGAGKSTVGFLVAKEISASFCHTFNPTSPGENLNRLAQVADVSEIPLVLVIEEVDILIEQIHANNVTRHKEVQTSIYNKSTYNTFMDDMFFFKNVILIMTSNTSSEKICELDPSYLRKGRINASYSMMTPLVCKE
jgi:hypothetical protein